MNLKQIKSKFFSSRLITIIVFIIIVYASFGLAKITYQNYKVNQKIADLEKNIEKIDEDNFELQSKITYYKTNAYKERQAREELNMQKPGEIVVVIPTGTQPEKEKIKQKENKKTERSNYQAWWDYFFSNQ
jgi:cell division protein FtsL